MASQEVTAVYAAGEETPAALFADADAAMRYARTLGDGAVGFPATAAVKVAADVQDALDARRAPAAAEVAPADPDAETKAEIRAEIAEERRRERLRKEVEVELAAEEKKGKATEVRG